MSNTHTPASQTTRTRHPHPSVEAEFNQEGKELKELIRQIEELKEYAPNGVNLMTVEQAGPFSTKFTSESVDPIRAARATLATLEEIKALREAMDDDGNVVDAVLLEPR